MVDITNVLTQISDYSNMDGVDNFLEDLGTNVAEPTVAELKAIEDSEAREQLNKKIKIKEPSKPNVQTKFEKPKPKVKAALPQDLFGMSNSYKTTTMVSLEELTTKADAEIKAYNNRVTPLIERVVGTANCYKFVSEDLMFDFANDYQAEGMARSKLLRRYMLDGAVVLFDLYKIIANHLNLDMKANHAVIVKQTKEELQAQVKSALYATYCKIKSSNYIAPIDKVRNLYDVELIEQPFSAVEVKADNTELESVEQNKLLITPSDYELIPQTVFEAVIETVEKLKKEEATALKEQEKAKKSFLTKTLVIKQMEDTNAIKQTDNADITNDVYYDPTLPNNINEDNKYLKYKATRCRSINYFNTSYSMGLGCIKTED